MAGAIQRSSRRGRGRRGSRLNADINIAPLVDVMLVLLLIFMMTAKDLLSGVDVQLPKTDATTLPVTKDPLMITVQRDGEVFINDDTVTLDDLVNKLSAIAGNGFDERIYLRGDAETRHEDIMLVMSRINGAGYTNIGLVTEPIGEQ